MKTGLPERINSQGAFFQGGIKSALLIQNCV